MIRLSRVAVSLWMACVILSWAAAADSDGAAERTEKRAPANATNAEIAQLIAKLDADQFSEREAASAKLAEIGKPAIGPLQEAAQGETLEVTSRAIEILKRLCQSVDESLKAAAQEALERLAASRHPSAARRAKEALGKEEPAAGASGWAMNANVIPGGAMILNGLGGNIQFQIGGGAAGLSTRVSTSNINGIKRTDAEENGRKVKIMEDPNQGIRMEITTIKDGKETTEKIEAKDADELRGTNQPAYELYKQYSDAPLPGIAMGGIALGGMQWMPGNMAPPVAAGALPPQAAVSSPEKGPHADVKKLTSNLETWTRQLDESATEESLRGASAQSLDGLKKQAGQMRAKLDALEKRLDALGGKDARQAPPAETSNDLAQPAPE